MKIVIADTSCLILYEKIDRLDILEKTFSELIISRKVAEEYGRVPEWVIIKQIIDRSSYNLLSDSLGKGEASSIILALEHQNALLIIDEKKGRNIAKGMNIQIIGSFGVLLKAKEKKVINSVKDILSLIDQTDFRISKQIKEYVLKKAGE